MIRPATGSDVLPIVGMIERLRGLGDSATVAILEVILREEVAHVAAGSRWFRWFCEQRAVAPGPTFRALLSQHARAVLHPPFNVDARTRAGFDGGELAMLDALSQEARTTRF